MVVGGLRRSLRHGYDGRFSPDETLACRLSGDTVTKLAGLLDGRELIDRGVEHGAVPGEADALVIEAAVEDPFADYNAYAEEFAARYSVAYQALLDALAGEASLFVWSITFPSRGASLNALSLKDGVGASPAGITIWRQAWVPLYLEWELHLDLHDGLAGWDLDELDYEPPADAVFRPGQVTVLAGRSLLVSASARALADQVSAFLAEEDKLDLRGQGRVSDDLQGRLRALSTAAGLVDVLAAGVAGLGERLLGFTDETALGSVGSPPPPVPTAPPRPLRAGFARLRKLRLVDAFGRTLTLVDAGQPAPILGAGLHTATTGELLLRPRLNQPARLLLRMVDAADDTREAGVDQAAESVSPLVGWLLADHADEAVELFDPEGTPLGQLTHDGLSGAVAWEGPPGDRAPVGTQPGAALSGDPRLKHLRGLVTALLERDALERAAAVTRSDTPLEALLRVIDTTSATVGLGGQTGTEHLAHLVGRPIAVVRATLRLDVEPEPAFPTLSQADRAARTASWAALAGWAFPVRLGALTRLDDGLLGFWVNDDYGRLHPVHPSVLTKATPSARHQGDFAAVAASTTSPRPIDSPSVAHDPTVPVRPGQTVRLTLLMDPAARVHATSGLLPRKAISLLRDWFAEALDRVVPSFRVGPVLVDPTTIRMPLAAALGRDQAWTRRDGPTSWHDDPIAAATQQALLPETPAVVHEGYLRVALEEEGR